MEQVCRISDVLEDLSAIRFLRDHLSLYGGTPLAFIYSPKIRRLSIDIDFNYRHLDKEEWGDVRNDIDEQLKALLYRQGYERVDLAISPSYPLTRFTVRYKSTYGLRDSFRIEIGYLRRYPILKEDVFAAFRHIGTQETFLLKTPQQEELFANKWCVLLYRRTPRDLFDISQIAALRIDPDLFRKCAVVDSLMRGPPKLHEINIRHVINQISINSSLRNLLLMETASQIIFEKMREEVIRFSESIMASLTKNEVSAIEHFFSQKKLNLELLDEGGIFHEKLREHPSLLWALSKQ